MRVRIKIARNRRKLEIVRKPSKWLAVGAIAAYTAAGGGPSVLLAQGPGPTAAPASQSSTVVRFSIGAGPLSDALAEFERAAGWKVEIPDPRMGTLPSKGVSGALSINEALRRLLAGTGLNFTMAAPGRVRLTVDTVRGSIDVSDRAPLSNPRYTEPLRNLPQTITVIPKEIINQQGATSLAEVLRNVPGMTMTAGEGGAAAGDNLTLRGNSARNDIFVDGVRDLSPQSRDPFNIESVEVTKGPTSALTGRGSAGGAINLVSKGPNINRYISGSVALGNADTRRASLDINTPLSKLNMGERSAFRMNGLIHDAGVAGRDVVKNDRWGLAPSLAFGLGTPTRLTLGYYKLKQDNISDYGIPWVPATNNALSAYRDQPAPVPRETFYGFRDRDREVLNQDTATVKIEHDFSDLLSLRSQLRYGKAGRNSIASPPRFAGNDTTAINREMRAWVAQDSIWDNQTDIRAQADTFGIRHTLVTGVAFTNEKNTRINRTAPNSPTTLLNPNPDDIYTGVITTTPYTGRITGNTQSIWAFDTAKFGQHWEATGGARWERFDVNGVNTTPAPVVQNVKFASVRAGLIYKPTQSGSIYTSYGNSVSPSLEGLSYNTSNTAIPPEKTFTTEVGSKWEVGGGRLLLTGALFRVAKDNARTPPLLPTDPPQVLAGRQVSQGIEFSASGAITRSLHVLGSYTLIDARIRSSNTPIEVGRYFQNTPRNAASAWVTYAAKRFTLGLGPRFMGRRFGNNSNTRQVEAYGTVDAMVSYNVNKYLDLRFNLSNLNDSYYFERLGGGHLIPGPSRYALVTTNFHF
jgi:catecholate siderophore receptor